jgi:hypothetical protein
MMNEALRSVILADLRPVRRLHSPIRRALAIVPLGLVLLVAAPAVFDFRDLAALGLTWSWGASIVQLAGGIALIALSLREAVPGREWSSAGAWSAAAAVVALFLVVTGGSWWASPVVLARAWWTIGVMCAAGSAVSALPAVVLSSLLIVRAFPLHPARSGVLAGFGSGLLADAGWRLFCHFSEPAHVVAAHLGGIGVAATAGAALTTWLSRDRSRGRS